MWNTYNGIEIPTYEFYIGFEDLFHGNSQLCIWLKLARATEVVEIQKNSNIGECGVAFRERRVVG